MSEFANIQIQGGGVAHMILNVTMKLRGSLSEVIDQIDAFTELQGVALDGRPTVHQATSFKKSYLADTDQSGHSRKVCFRLKVPVEVTEAGHRKSPTSVAGRYMEEFVHSVQYRNAGNRSTGPIDLESHCLKFAAYKLEPVAKGTQSTAMPATR